MGLYRYSDETKRYENEDYKYGNHIGLLSWRFKSFAGLNRFAFLLPYELFNTRLKIFI
jgi:hypothetical protein